MTCPDLARGTRRARADRDARQIELDDQCLGTGTGQRQARRIGQARRPPGDDDGLGRNGTDLPFQPLPQPSHALHLSELAPRRFGGRTEARDGRNVLRAGATAPLLASAADERRQGPLPADHERTRPLRTAQLVRRQRQVIDAEVRDVDGNATGGLHRIGVHSKPMPFGFIGNSGHRLQHTSFVVGELQRQQRLAP
jgi:hypothetical protein